MAQPFVPKGYLCVDDAIAALREDQESIADARLRLRTALRAGAVRAVIQDRKTGLLRMDDPHHWAGANGDNHLSDNGEVYLHGRQFGAGVWCDFLIVESTIREFLGTAASVKGDTQRDAAPSDDRQHGVATTPNSEPSPTENEMKPQRRLAEAKIEPEFRLWRDQQSGGYIPTEAEDIAYMKQLGVSRDTVRELRRKFPTRVRGQKRSS